VGRNVLSVDENGCVPALLRELGEVYAAYTQNAFEGSGRKRGVTRLFRRWFASFDPMAVQPVHQAFLDDVERIVKDLARALESIQAEFPEKTAAYAAQALDIIFSSKPSRQKTTAEWYVTVSEYQSEMLLPYASPDKLQSVRIDMLRRTPKRLMFPKQRQLLDAIESRIMQQSEKRR